MRQIAFTAALFAGALGIHTMADAATATTPARSSSTARTTPPPQTPPPTRKLRPGEPDPTGLEPYIANRLRYDNHVSGRGR